MNDEELLYRIKCIYNKICGIISKKHLIKFNDLDFETTIYTLIKANYFQLIECYLYDKLINFVYFKKDKENLIINFVEIKKLFEEYNNISIY